MRLAPTSDAHIEFDRKDAPWSPDLAGVDALLLAGDTHVRGREAQWLRGLNPPCPVIGVGGNHTYYQGHVPRSWEKLQAASAELPQVHWLENETVEVGGVVFAGCTLWSDLALDGDAQRDAGIIAREMNDFRLIRTGAGFRRMQPADVRRWHAHSVAWLGAQFAKYRGRPLVVLTHFAPSALSLAAKERAENTAPYYASHLDELVKRSGARLWLHGHIHHRSDYMLGETRVLCNPRGYPSETTGFDETLRIEIS